MAESGRRAWSIVKRIGSSGVVVGPEQLEAITVVPEAELKQERCHLEAAAKYLDEQRTRAEAAEARADSLQAELEAAEIDVRTEREGRERAEVAFKQMHTALHTPGNELARRIYEAEKRVAELEAELSREAEQVTPEMLERATEALQKYGHDQDWAKMRPDEMAEVALRASLGGAVG